MRDNKNQPSESSSEYIIPYGEYYRGESWEALVEKVAFWADTQFSKFINNKTSQLKLINIETIEFKNGQGVKFSYDEMMSPGVYTSRIHLVIHPTRPGMVQVVYNEFNDEIPLSFNHGFKNLHEASDWLKENQGFYRPDWERLIEKV